MRRVYTNFRKAGEIVFVDATGCVDYLNTSVVPFLCAGPAGAAAITTAVRRLHQVRSENQLNGLLYNLGSGTCNTGAGRGKIRCQPTSIPRRGPGKPRGAAPLGKGQRPSSIANRKWKRPRSLSSNVSQNVANAKSHGTGH